MAVAPPRSLSPSKVAAFTDCALAFRFAAIDRLPEPPSLSATKGTLVHAALQKLMFAPPERRTLDAAIGFLAEAERDMADDPELLGLALDAEAQAAFVAEAETLVGRYFELEDPAQVRPMGVELLMEADIGGAWVRGIIDRLELDADGELVVTDYKTGRAPERAVRAGPARRCPRLRPAVRAAAGPAAGPGPAPLPGRPGRDHLHAERARRAHGRAPARRRCGRPWSGPAPTRASGPDRPGSATTARSRPTARPSAAIPTRAGGMRPSCGPGPRPRPRVSSSSISTSRCPSPCRSRPARSVDRSTAGPPVDSALEPVDARDHTPRGQAAVPARARARRATRRHQPGPHRPAARGRPAGQGVRRRRRPGARPAAGAATGRPDDVRPVRAGRLLAPLAHDRRRPRRHRPAHVQRRRPTVGRARGRVAAGQRGRQVAVPPGPARSPTRPAPTTCAARSPAAFRAATPAPRSPRRRSSANAAGHGRSTTGSPRWSRPAAST